MNHVVCARDSRHNRGVRIADREVNETTSVWFVRHREFYPRGRARSRIERQNSFKFRTDNRDEDRGV